MSDWWSALKKTATFLVWDMCKCGNERDCELPFSIWGSDQVQVIQRVLLSQQSCWCFSQSCKISLRALHSVSLTALVMVRGQKAGLYRRIYTCHADPWTSCKHKPALLSYVFYGAMTQHAWLLKHKSGSACDFGPTFKIVKKVLDCSLHYKQEKRLIPSPESKHCSKCLILFFRYTVWTSLLFLPCEAVFVARCLYICIYNYIGIPICIFARFLNC